MDLEEELFGEGQDAGDYLPHSNQSQVPTSEAAAQISPDVWKINVKFGKNASVLEALPSLPANMFIAEAASSLEGIYAEYLKIIVSGKVIASDDPRSIAEIGLKNGAKVTMMHSPEFHKDRAALNALEAIGSRIAALEATTVEMGSAAFLGREDALTKILEELDGVDTTGRPTLRQVRKRLVQRAQQASQENNANTATASASL